MPLRLTWRTQMDACLMPLCERIKELDPAVTDMMLENMVHGFASCEHRWILHTWIEDLEAEIFAESTRPELSLILEA